MTGDQTIRGRGMQRRRFLKGLAYQCASLALLGACAEPASTENTRADRRRAIETSFDATLARSYLADPSSRALVAGAVGVLVFPTVTLVNPVTGEWSGSGALRVGPVVTDYLMVSTGRLDSRPGAPARAIIVLFKTLDALNRFRTQIPGRFGAALGQAPSTAPQQSSQLGTARQDVVSLMLQQKELTTNWTLPDMAIVRLDI